MKKRAVWYIPIILLATCMTGPSLFLNVAAARNSVVSSGATKLTILATDQDIPGDLLVYKGYVYWIDFFSSPSAINKVPVGGGNALTIQAQPSPYYTGIAVYGNSVYYSNSSGLYRTTVNGGPSTFLASISCDPVCAAGSIIVHSSSQGTFVYFVNGNKIERVAVTGGRPELVYSDDLSLPPYWLAISGSYIYWYDLHIGLPSIGRVPLTGGTGEILYSGFNNQCPNETKAEIFTPLVDSNILVSRGFIYWTSSFGCWDQSNPDGIYYAYLNRMSITGGPIKVLFFKFSTNNSSIETNGLASFSSFLIFAYDSGATQGRTGIYEVSDTGGQARQLISSKSAVTQYLSVAVSASRVYFTNNTAVESFQV